MYKLQVCITSEDVLNKLSEKDKERFNKCVFTDVIKHDDRIDIACLLLSDNEDIAHSHDTYMYRLTSCDDGMIELK